MTVYCPELVPPKKSSFWDKQKDDFLREWYNDRVRVDPKMLAMSLGTQERKVTARLRELNLRKLSGRVLKAQRSP